MSTAKDAKRKGARGDERKNERDGAGKEKGTG